MNKEELIHSINQCFKSPLREYLIASIEATISIQSTDTDKNKFNKIGGIPWLQKDEVWPRSADSGLPLLFLLSVDLNSLAEFNLELKLPTKGLLNFYFAADNWEEGLVHYYKNTNDLIQATAPKEHFLELQQRERPFWKQLFSRKSPFYLLPETNITFKKDYQIPSHDSIAAALFEREQGKKIYNFHTNDRLIEQTFLDDASMHQHHLFEYYQALQESKYELEIIKKNDLSKAKKWKLLLKISSDKSQEFNFGDGGNILFFIHEEDLKKHNFSRVRAFLDST